MPELMNRPVAIRQEMQAGSDFAGTAPEDGSGLITATQADDIIQYTAGTVGGGLFDFTSDWFKGEKGGATDLIGISLDLGSSIAYTITKVDVDGNETLLWSGTAQYFEMTEETKIVFLSGTQFKIATTAGAAAMVATLLFEDHREPNQG